MRVPIYQYSKNGNAYGVLANYKDEFTLPAHGPRPLRDQPVTLAGCHGSHGFGSCAAQETR